MILWPMWMKRTWTDPTKYIMIVNTFSNSAKIYSYVEKDAVDYCCSMADLMRYNMMSLLWVESLRARTLGSCKERRPTSVSQTTFANCSISIPTLG